MSSKDWKRYHEKLSLSREVVRASINAGLMEATIRCPSCKKKSLKYRVLINNKQVLAECTSGCISWIE